MSLIEMVDVLDKAHNGPLCTLKDWNVRVLPKSIAAKLKEHCLNGTYDPDNPVNCDDELADRFFQAAFELAVETGVLCQDTERIMKFSEDELRMALKNAPDELILGKGQDARVIKHRKPEDTYPTRCSAPTAIIVSEDIFVPFTQAMVQYPEIDVLEGATLPTVLGRKVLADTPYETLVGWYEAQLSKEALWRAGRPGMCKTGILSSPTAFGHLGGFGHPGGLDPEKDVALVLTPGELTTSYEPMHKVIQTNAAGGRVLMNYGTMIGGFSGPPEGAALAAIAMGILSFAAHPRIHMTGVDMVDVTYFGNTGRAGVWAHSILHQAYARNTHYVSWDMLDAVGGPGEDMLLYEDAVIFLTYSVSGGCGCFTTRSTGVKYPEYLTPLECRFSAEVAKRSAGMTRKQANEIVKKLIPRYEDKLKNPPKGKSFRELFDLQTLKPVKEYVDLYLRIKKELIELGIPLDPHY